MAILELQRYLTEIRTQKPLVHNITNYVVMNFTANTLLAMGAAPVMAHAKEEVAEMVSLAGALVLNIGTLSDHWIEAMFAAGRRANELGIPVILDPVGAGATTFRTETFRNLVKGLKLAVVRGNASEILSLVSAEVKTKGVESVNNVEEAVAPARKLARDVGAVVAITGKTDLITDGNEIIWCHNGHPMLGKITGAGCAATTSIAAFACVARDYLAAAAAGLAFFGLAGEKAALRATAPGSFTVALIDALYEITPEEFASGARLERG